MSRALQILVFAAVLVAQVSPAERIVNTVPDVARPLPLTAVRLTGGPLKRAQDLDATTCSSSIPIACWRSIASARACRRKREGYGGWDGDGRQLTGHIAGHYLSAVS